MSEERSFDYKRREIFSAALELFAARGFEGTTLEAVADALGYTKPALYYYFKSKDDLFLSLILQSLQEADERIRGIAGRDASAADRLREVIHLLLEDHFTSRGYFSISHVLPGFRAKMTDAKEREELERLSADIPQQIIGIIEQGVSGGEFMREDPRMLGSVVFGMISGLLIHMSIPALAAMDQATLTSKIDAIVIKGISV